MNRSLILLPTVIAAALALAACSPRDNQTAGQKVDQTVAAAKAGVEDAKAAASKAAGSMTATATDATITTKINAALIADDKLKALKIDVDTNNGRVVLSGTAPDAESRERATTLARVVEGVTDVDNRLAIAGKS